MIDTAKNKLPHRKAALTKLDPADRLLVNGAIVTAQKRLKQVGEDGAIELVAALGEWLAARKAGKP